MKERFNEQELNKSIKQLKTNKAAGVDKISNEYINQLLTRFLYLCSVFYYHFG